MHEMSLAMNVIDLAEEHCRKQDCRKQESQPVRRITALWLEVGALSCATPETIRYCFEIASRETLAEGASLHIHKPAGEAWCLDCEATVPLEIQGAPCPNCAGFNLKLTQGDELRIKEIEVE